jgi:hypothetical protein
MGDVTVELNVRSFCGKIFDKALQFKMWTSLCIIICDRRVYKFDVIVPHVSMCFDFSSHFFEVFGKYSHSVATLIVVASSLKLCC